MFNNICYIFCQFVYEDIMGDNVKNLIKVKINNIYFLISWATFFIVEDYQVGWDDFLFINLYWLHLGTFLSFLHLRMVWRIVSLWYQCVPDWPVALWIFHLDILEGRADCFSFPVAMIFQIWLIAASQC